MFREKPLELAYSFVCLTMPSSNKVVMKSWKTDFSRVVLGIGPVENLNVGNDFGDGPVVIDFIPWVVQVMVPVSLKKQNQISKFFVYNTKNIKQWSHTWMDEHCPLPCLRFHHLDHLVEVHICTSANILHVCT